MSDWTRDVDERRARMPKQVIDSDDWVDGGGNMRVSPAWYWQCLECGDEKRYASEDESKLTKCEACGEITRQEPVGELIYPGGDEP